jgi:uncharacterized protein (UPF0335 family)
VVSALLTRAENIVTNESDIKQEKYRVISALSANNYDHKTIKRVQNRIDKRKVTPKENNEQELIKHVNLPYTQGTSEQLRRILRKHKIRSTFYSTDTLRQKLSHPKDPIEMDNKNNIIYKIPCKDCNATYIGESKRCLGTRTKEHQAAVRKGNVDKNEIAEHCWQQDHHFDFDQRQIIDKEQKWTARKIKEAIHSEWDKNHINNIQYKLPDIWKPALKQ